MRRVSIRNTGSRRETKPRVFDAIIKDDGDVDLEVKQGKTSEVIPLKEVLKQIKSAKKMTTEP